jgi:hypothetical protein
MSTIENLQQSTDSADKTRLLFDRYFTQQLSYPSNQVNAVVGFFEKRGFDELASTSVTSVLLQQAKTDGINIFELLDSLKGFDKVKLSNMVTAVLNVNRSKISKLGYREPPNLDNLEARNIVV